MEVGWCFVTGQNETTNTWWNQDLQVVVHIPRLLPLPYMYDTCSEYFQYIQNFTFLFSHRGNLNYCSLSMFYVCYIRYLCQARVNEHTGKQAWWRGVPRPQALFQKNFLFPIGVYPITEKAMATHSSTLAWKIPWTEEPGRLQSTGLLRVGHNWATSLSFFTFTHWRKWQPTPVFLPGESQGRGSLGGCTESDTMEAT